VIEACGLPGRGVVTQFASLGESAGHVVGIGCSLEILEVARHAGIRSQVVIVVGMAIGASARRHGVRAGQREIDRRMIKGGRRPACGRMARVAGRGKVQRDVIRVCRALEILQMATHAGRARQRVVVIHVAIGTGARRNRVQPGELEARGVVVKCRVHPVGSVVTGFAGLREIRAGVIGIRCALEIFQVAVHASGGAQRVVAADVTIRALTRRDGVHSGQGEASGGVIELGIGPLHGVVASLASRRETGVGHGTERTGEIFLVARVARQAGQVVIVVDVAVRALARRNSVAAGQKESGCRVIKLGIKPVVGRVAGFASGRKLGSDVVRI